MEGHLPELDWTTWWIKTQLGYSRHPSLFLEQKLLSVGDILDPLKVVLLREQHIREPNSSINSCMCVPFLFFFVPPLSFVMKPELLLESCVITEIHSDIATKNLPLKKLKRHQLLKQSKTQLPFFQINGFLRDIDCLQDYLLSVKKVRLHIGLTSFKQAS